MGILRNSAGATYLWPVLAALWMAAAPARAAEEHPATIESTPQQYYDGAYNNAKRRMPGEYTGNSWTWHACYPMHGFLDAYEATKDTAWLDAAEKYFDWTIGLLRTGPDGYQGWLGPVSGKEGQIGEHVVGDAIMIDPMVRFAAIVLKDEPELAARYGTRARAYVALAKKLMFEKWEKRGIWHEDGPYGVFTEWPWHYTEQEHDRWLPAPPGTRAITLPFNMQVHWGIVAGRIHRITGEKEWRTKALRLFNFMKSRLCLYDDHYSWNYWEPFGAWDIDPNNPQAFRHWVNTHGYRDYQAGEIAAVVDAYNLGLTFDEQDMRRFVKTNMKVMWKGKLDDIQWNNSNAGVQIGALGRIRLPSPPRGIFNRYAGTLWTDLAQFDATARQLYEKQLTPGAYQHAYYYNVTRRRPPSYARLHPELPADVFDVPLSPCCTLTMVTAIPSTVPAGQSAVVCCMTRVPGDLKIELLAADGKESLAVLRPESPRQAGILNLKWEPGKLAAGPYRIRWTLKGQSRDFPISVQ